MPWGWLALKLGNWRRGGRLYPSIKTAMSEPRLPQEIIDYIVDLLRNERGTLSQCCLVSKSWIPRTRKHLFGEINFTSPTDPEEWMRMFPDPSNSPARYSHCLRIRCARDPIPEATKMGGWILSLTNVVRLVIIGSMWSLISASPTSPRSQIFLRSLLGPLAFVGPRDHLFPAPPQRFAYNKPQDSR